MIIIIEQPLLSVIIPIYNAKDFLKSTLDSIVNQSYKNLEIILVDDCSTDGSELICDEYAKKDPRIKVKHRTINSGECGTPRNDGVALSNGDYITFFDADDFLIQGTYELYINTFLKYNVDMVKGNSMTYWSFPFPLKNKTEIHYSKDEDLINFYTLSRDAVVTNMACKRELALKCRFPKARFCEDNYYTGLQYLQANSVAFLNRYILHYRDNPNSICHTIGETRRYEQDFCVSLLWYEVKKKYGDKYDNRFAKFILPENLNKIKEEIKKNGFDSYF